MCLMVTDIFEEGTELIVVGQKKGLVEKNKFRKQGNNSLVFFD